MFILFFVFFFLDRLHIFYNLTEIIYHFNKVSFLYFKIDPIFQFWRHLKEDVAEVIKNKKAKQAT